MKLTFVASYLLSKKTLSHLLKSFISPSIWNDFMLLIWRYLPQEFPSKKNPPRNLSVCPSDSWPKVKVHKKNHIRTILQTKSRAPWKKNVPGFLKLSKISTIHWNTQNFSRILAITFVIFSNLKVGMLNVIVSLKWMVSINLQNLCCPKLQEFPGTIWNLLRSPE